MKAQIKVVAYDEVDSVVVAEVATQAEATKAVESYLAKLAAEIAEGIADEPTSIQMQLGENDPIEWTGGAAKWSNDTGNWDNITPELLAEMAQAAWENWDMDALDCGELMGQERKEYVEAYREALNFGGDPVDYAKRNWANDDGLIEYAGGQNVDWWDWLEEFATATADNALRYTA